MLPPVKVSILPVPLSDYQPAIMWFGGSHFPVTLLSSAI